MTLVQQLHPDAVLVPGVYKVVVQVASQDRAEVARVMDNASSWARRVSTMEKVITGGVFGILHGGFHYHFPVSNYIDLKTGNETLFLHANFNPRKGYDPRTGSMFCLIGVSQVMTPGTVSDLYYKLVRSSSLFSTTDNTFQIYKLIPQVAAPRGVKITAPTPSVSGGSVVKPSAPRPTPKPNSVRTVVNAVAQKVIPPKKVPLSSAVVPGVPVHKDTSPGSKGPSVKSVASDVTSKPQNLVLIGVLGTLGYLIYASAGGS